MLKGGLLPIDADGNDYSIVPTFGGITPDPTSFPPDFSIYDGREVPNQEMLDLRFTPPLPQLFYGCTGESGSMASALEDGPGTLYDPQDLYLNTPPKGNTTQGRDIRLMLSVLKNRGPRKADGTFGPKRGDYYNCYGAGKIDDFDAARIGLWINQFEKRGVIAGSWWYLQFAVPGADGSLQTPDFDTRNAALHCYLITGWRTKADGTQELQVLSWQGMDYGQAGIVWMSRSIYNASMAVPYTGAFTIAKTPTSGPQTVGMQAQFDQVVARLVAFVRQIYFGLARSSHA